ncbi:MAG TPA: CHAP domain-containing protein [Rhizomicrobium sp.]|nr:CHAP domain-containing protein [Rhizomicrobium sp.]
MIRLDCAGRATAISLLATVVVLFGAHSADARKLHHRHHHVARAHAAATIEASLPDSDIVDPALKDSGVMLSDPTLSIITQDDSAPAPTPTIVRPLRRIYCVEYARLASGISIFGDARTWWDKARYTYAQTSTPTPGAVMVFDPRRKMRLGHVAVVKRVLSAREVIVDHANWGRDGKIYLNAPVVDVSANNDWSQVRVWNTRAGTMGSSTYAIKGFISVRNVAMN